MYLVLQRQKVLTWQELPSTAYGQQVPPKPRSVTSHKTAILHTPRYEPSISHVGCLNCTDLNVTEQPTNLILSEHI